MHRPYWITCYIMFYPSDLRLIVSGSPSRFIIPPYIRTYPNIPLPITPTHPYPSPPPLLLLHAPLLSLGFPEQATPTITLIFIVLVAALPPDTSP